MNSNKLRIGILLDSFQTTAWIAQMITDLTQLEEVDVALVVLNNQGIPACNSSALGIDDTSTNTLHRFVRRGLTLAYEKLIERNTYLPDALAAKNCESSLEHAEKILVEAHSHFGKRSLSIDDVQKVKSKNIDVLVHCGVGEIQGDILDAANCGVWSFHHGDDQLNKGGPAGFWESMDSWPESGSLLQILTHDSDNGQVLCRSYACTDPMSIKDNRSNYYWKSLAFLRRKLQELHRLGKEAFFAKVSADNAHPQFFSHRNYTSPTNRELACLLAKKVKEKAQLMFDNWFISKQWVLLYTFSDTIATSLWRYKEITPPSTDRFWADPFIIQRDDKYFVYFEEYFFTTHKGRINCIEMDGEGNYSEPKVILEKDYHLSYPFLFEDDGQWYMIPESMENRCIQLYKCVEFPYKWEFQCNLMEDVDAVDATLYQKDNKWWMFVNLVEHDGASSWDEMYLFHAERFDSQQWTPHPQNPVVSDCRSSRPAGQLFEHNGNLYRPSQNSSKRYGYGFNLNQILELNETSYKEKVVSNVHPNWEKGLTGTHTFNRVGRLNMSDALKRRWKLG